MIIVTGGAGFIGSNIVKKLNENGRRDILVVDDLTDGTKFVNLLDYDIADYIDKDDFIAGIMAGDNIGDIDAIFHLGACSSTMEWDGKFLMQNNYEYSKELLHYCVDQCIPFLYASSAAVYGGQNLLFSEQRECERPLNAYAYSKYLFDHYVRKLLHLATSQVCGFRYFNVYGPHESHKGSMASIAYHLNEQVKQGEVPTLFEGSDVFLRDFIYVDDAADVNMWFWKNKHSGIFNCGTGRAESFQSIADAVLAYHRTSDIRYIPFPDKLKGRYQAYTQADLTQLRATGCDIRFKPVAEGVNEYMSWLNREV